MSRVCNCPHGKHQHGVTGACLVVDEATGPCPCSATPPGHFATMRRLWLERQRPATRPSKEPRQ